MRDFSAVLAVDERWGLGKDGTIPWRVPADMRRFKALTTSTAVTGMRNAVIMGRRTWDSLPDKFRPLPDRLNVVLSRAGFEAPAGVVVCSSLDEALLACEEPEYAVESVYVIGGAEIYAEALHHYRCVFLEMTRIDGDYACDVFVNPHQIEAFFKRDEMTRSVPEQGPPYQFEKWRRIN